MSSYARSSREEERRLSIRTLIIASVGSALAAIITSQFWTSGTPIAAAATPVIVTLVSELLRRPTERIAQRFTTETAAPPETDALPEAAGAGAPPPREEWDPHPAREPPARDPYMGDAQSGDPPEFRVYRTASTSRRLHWKLILATAAIAFAIAAAVLTLPELIAGQSVGGGGREFTLWGGSAHKEKTPAQETPAQTQETQPGSQTTQPQQTTTEPQATEMTVPEPKKTTPEPQATQPPAQTAPAPRSQTPAPPP